MRADVVRALRGRDDPRVRREGRRPGRRARSLSGGNLQKYIVGREIRQQPKMMIAAQPTWGVDVGAAAQIRQALLDLRDSGVAVLVVSEELDELFEICDRLAVIAQGRLSDAKPVRDTNAEEIGLLMSGSFIARAAARPGHQRHVLAAPGVLDSESTRPCASASKRVPSRRGSPAGCRRSSPRWPCSSSASCCSRAMGKNPWQALYVFFIEPVDTLYDVGELLLKASPIMLCAVGLAVGYRANVWNIGAEGQLIMGAIFGGGVALAFHDSESPLRAAADARRRHGRRHAVGGDSRRSCARASTPTRSWCR